ncbi:MAG: hypothetical protein ACP5JJ_17015, partial [Anaerolineae bacterium]
MTADLRNDARPEPNGGAPQKNKGFLIVVALLVAGIVLATIFVVVALVRPDPAPESTAIPTATLKPT